MFDREDVIKAVTRFKRVARVVIAAQDGSSPRDIGTAMLVWDGGQSGTIGGGALEHEAVLRARAALADPLGASTPLLTREPLGPKLGQCCGGAVSLVMELYEAQATSGLPDDLLARPVTIEARNSAMPLAVKRLLDRARGQGVSPQTTLLQGWLIEPIARPGRDLWVWGAGHVGRAVVSVLAPLPDFAVTWVDVARDRYPDQWPENVTALPTADPTRLIPHCPKSAEHLILTYSHPLDLALCHGLLQHGFARCGLIGSKTKAARFRSRLASLGHGPAEIARIDCPIGDPGLGKHPQAIAIGVARSMLISQLNPSRQEYAG
jgi:xanthine dehydrogenase accessory factor